MTSLAAIGEPERGAALLAELKPERGAAGVAAAVDGLDQVQHRAELQRLQHRDQRGRWRPATR